MIDPTKALADYFCTIYTSLIGRLESPFKNNGILSKGESEEHTSELQSPT